MWVHDFASPQTEVLLPASLLACLQISAYTEKYNSFTPSQFECQSAEDEISPDAYVETDENTLEGQCSIDPPQFARWIHIKFLSSHSFFDGDTIDVGVVGIVVC